MFTLVRTNRLRHLEFLIFNMEARIMAAIDDLTTAVTDLTTASTNYTAAVAAEIAAIQAANQSGAQDAAIETSVANIKALTDTFNAATAAAQAAVPPAPPAPPAA